MKLLKKMSPRARGNDHGGGNGSSTATTVSFLSDGEIALLPPSPNANVNHDDDTTSTRVRTNQTDGAGAMARSTPRVRALSLKRLRQRVSGRDKADAVAEARERAARRLEPPPFSASRTERLVELKEAKRRAEERGRHDSDVSSAPSVGARGATGSDVKEERLARRDAAAFLFSVALQVALFPLRRQYCISIILVAVQSLSLRALLGSVLVYAFDSVDFGQREIVRNMNYGKRLFVEEVRRCSSLISTTIAVGACAIELGGKMVRALMGFLCGHSFWWVSKICGDYDTAVADEPWGMEAFHISSFIMLRLGVFVLALLLMGYAMLPSPGKAAKGISSDDAADGGGARQRRASLPCHVRGCKRTPTDRSALATFSVSLLLATTAAAGAGSSCSKPKTRLQRAVRTVLVAGSLNADTFLPVERLPSPGENLMLLPGRHPVVDVPGGKGCNQAIAFAKLSQKYGVSFLGQFGNDPASEELRDALVDGGVDVSLCGRSRVHPSGRGYVMIVPDTGEVSAVVSGGSNLYGWSRWGVKKEPAGPDEGVLTDDDIRDIVSPHSLLLIQCEVPSLINLRLARAARELEVPVIFDAGGEDRRMERELLECCDYLIPNETELERLAIEDGGDQAISTDDMDQNMKDVQARIGPSLHLPSIMKSVRTLQRNGANNVLVTLGSRGSVLIRRPAFVRSQSSLIYQPSSFLPSGLGVVDETGAGDCYRAGFALALLERCGDSILGSDVDDEVLQQCMEFASAAGALAVTREGAVPSIPSREEVEKHLAEVNRSSGDDSVKTVPRGGNTDGKDKFPFLFGSRLNSMKDRLDLVDPSMPPPSTPRDYVRRQAAVRGLGCVDFNYPQHFEGYWNPDEAKRALDEAGLVAGAVCLRYPVKFARGAMNHPDPWVRREAVDMTKRAAEVARMLGCNEVVVWSAYDGYDYPFQVSYQEKWHEIVEAFRECCDAYPDIKWSLEYKPTDENTRFFTVPSTGAALLLVNEIDRPNMGLTLDMGHMLMSGENPGQSIAMVGEKLFGVQLNDGYTRLAAEDGMMFGSVHPAMALEVMYQLHQIGFKGHMYFDTFPQRTDPVKEAEYNIRRVKELWGAVEMMDRGEVERIAREHDAIGALELVNEALMRLKKLSLKTA